MRRVVVSLLAFALTGVLAPVATAADGELVIVADGPSYGYLDAPRALALDVANATMSATPYAVLVVAQGKTVTAFATRTPGEAPSAVSWWDTNVRAGRSVVRMLTPGRTTVRIPVRNLRGRLTVLLTRRMKDASAIVRNAVPDALDTVTDDIRFVVRTESVVVHGVRRAYDAAVGSVTEFCVTGADASCQNPFLDLNPLGESLDRGQYIWTWRQLGTMRAYYSSTGVGIGPDPVTHFLFAVPLA